MKKLLACLLCLFLTLAFLAGCSDGQEEIASMVQTDSAVSQKLPAESKQKTVAVHTVDEFLEALNSNTTITLSDGIFQLNEASDYGRDSDNPAYYWEAVPEGFQLVLNHLHDLTIQGVSIDGTAIMTAPRYANLLVLDSCKRIHIEELTAGHSDGAELCTGGVLAIHGGEDISLRKAGLFGSGIVGVSAEEVQGLHLEKCDIYDCSLYGLTAANCQDVCLEKTGIYSLGSPQDPASGALAFYDSQNLTVSDGYIGENQVMQLLQVINCQDVLFERMEFRSNRVVSSGFEFVEAQPVFDGCTFDGNQMRHWYESRSQMALDRKGALIGDDQLPPLPEDSPDALPKKETIRVTTSDEFLAAIGSDREIILDAALLDLSTASGYGVLTTPVYHWEDIFDGPGLVITDVRNLTIRAEGTELTDHTISAVPRYANVLSFRRCSDITLSGFTAGHTQAPGECTGGVLDFQDCDRITVDHCGLFGCGILGVNGQFARDITVKNCDIYECSLGGIQMLNVDGVRIEGNTFRDLGGPQVLIDLSENVSCDVPINDYPADYQY